MNYPKEVLDKIKILNEYEEYNELNEFDILHLYPKELAFPDGFTNSRFFELIVFNTVTMEKRNFGKHDGIKFFHCSVDFVQVFADGAFLVKMPYMTKVGANTQSLLCIKSTIGGN